jgi:hypothetical protein
MDSTSARFSIATGDLIAVRTAHSILGRLTQFFTRSLYTHTGVAIELAGRMFMAELNGGRNHLVPLSQISDYDVYACPEGLTDVEAAVLEWLRYQVDYGPGAFIAIGFLNWFKIKIFVHWRRLLVCSGYCVAIYETAGWPEHTRILSPRDLTELLTIKLAVRPV